MKYPARVFELILIMYFFRFILKNSNLQNSPNMLSYKAVWPSQLPQSCGHFYYGCGVLWRLMCCRNELGSCSWSLVVKKYCLRDTTAAVCIQISNEFYKKVKSTPCLNLRIMKGSAIIRRLYCVANILLNLCNMYLENMLLA